MREGFVGVHIGAGQHSEAKTQLYLSICAEACRIGVEVLRNGGSALEAACSATMVLENAGETNAGYGSNLTESGTVEMDAGIMDGTSLLFGAVGAMPGIKNPILVAKLLVEEQQKGLLPLGRVPPGFLVGEGARDWAVRHGVPAVSSESLISDKANKLYRHYKKKLDAFRSNVQIQLKRKRPESRSSGEDSCGSSSNSDDTTGHVTTDKLHHAHAHVAKHKIVEADPDHDHVTDTVGVVVLDRFGNVASTVSSGGIALKQPGRVGQASCFGCGCWAQRRRPDQSGHTIGISTTGCGEHLVRTFLARECAIELSRTDLPLTALERVMKHKFVESEFLIGVPEKLGGSICMHYNEADGHGEFLWTHTTASMGIAFQTTRDAKATTKMSRLPVTSMPACAPGGGRSAGGGGTIILVESVPFSTLPTTAATRMLQQEVESQSKVIVSSDTSGGRPQPQRPMYNNSVNNKKDDVIVSAKA